MDLHNYIADARIKNVPDDQITMTLKGAGWTEAQINQVLSSSNGLLPPPPVPHIGMWSGFIYILFFITLYIFATALAGMLHVWVEKTFPNTSSEITYTFFDVYSPEVVRGYLASIIVSFPLFVMLGVLLKRHVANQPFVKNLRSRKILIYSTLIITFLILISNIISTMYSYLDGNITGNTFGHFIVTFFVAGNIFLYFTNEIKNDRKI